MASLCSLLFFFSVLGFQWESDRVVSELWVNRNCTKTKGFHSLGIFTSEMWSQTLWKTVSILNFYYLERPVLSHKGPLFICDFSNHAGNFQIKQVVQKTLFFSGSFSQYNWLKLTKHVVITDCRIYFQCSELQPFWLSWGVEKDFGNKICRQSNDLLLCSAVMWQATTLVSNTVYGVKFKWHKFCIKYCLSAICDKISFFFYSLLAT